MKTKKVISRTLIAALAVMLFGTMLTPAASAQCGYWDSSKLGPVRFQPLSGQAPVTSRSGRLLLASDDRSDEAGIIGFWKVSFVAEGNNPGPPDGVTIDFGFQQWHSDGTEILNSGMRSPAIGNFCLGVWKKVGRSRYKLNHFALSYDPGGNFVGPANIREEVVLDRDADSYSGSFAITQFDQQGNTLAHVIGRVTGTRITVDTQP